MLGIPPGYYAGYTSRVLCWVYIPRYHGGYTPLVYILGTHPGYTIPPPCPATDLSTSDTHVPQPRLDGGLHNEQLVTHLLPTRVLPLPVSLLDKKGIMRRREPLPRDIPYG